MLQESEIKVINNSINLLPTYKTNIIPELLKDKLQPHWKPTEEQMEALDNVCNGYYVPNVLGNDVLEKIKSLYDNLKKL